MATGQSPLNSIMARQLVQRLAQGGKGGSGGPGAGGPGQPPPGAGGAAGSDGNDAAGEQLSSQFAELQGADPAFIGKTLQQIKGMMVSLYTRTAFTIPAASRHIAQCQKSIDAAMKEIESAAATQNAVRPAIANRAGMPGSAPQQPEQPDPSQGQGGQAGPGIPGM
jgi:hypothetical protein